MHRSGNFNLDVFLKGVPFRTRSVVLDIFTLKINQTQDSQFDIFNYAHELHRATSFIKENGWNSHASIFCFMIISTVIDNSLIQLGTDLLKSKVLPYLEEDINNFFVGPFSIFLLKDMQRFMFMKVDKIVDETLSNPTTFLSNLMFAYVKLIYFALCLSEKCPDGNICLRYIFQ